MFKSRSAQLQTHMFDHSTQALPFIHSFIQQIFIEHVSPARLPWCSGNKGAPKTNSLPACTELAFLGREIDSKNTNVTDVAEEKGVRKEWAVWPWKSRRASWEDDISAETWNPVCQMLGSRGE